jgi:hypothetical protein
MYNKGTEIELDEMLLRSGMAFYGMPKFETIERMDYQGEDEFLKGIANFINALVTIVDIPIYIMKMTVAVIESVMFMLNNDDEYYSGTTRKFRYYNNKWIVHVKADKGVAEGDVPEIEVYYDGQVPLGKYYYYLEDYEGHSQGDIVKVGIGSTRRW